MIQKLDVAKAYLIEANNDYDVVSMLIEKEKFSIAVYHAQQAVEKLLLNAFNDKIDNETMVVLEEAVVPLEENWAISRYPDWSVKPIWIPSQQITLDNANLNETRMRSVFEILVPFLKKNYKVQV